MKAACLLTVSMYFLAVFDSCGIGAGNETLGLEFAGIGEVEGRDGTTGAGSAGRGGVSVVSIGTGSWPSGVGAGSGTGVVVGSGTSTSAGPGTGVGAGSGTGVEVGSGTDTGAGPETVIGASYCGRFASDVLASDLGAGLPLDSAESWVVVRVVGV